MYDQIFVKRIEVKSLQGVGFTISDTSRSIGVDRPQVYAYHKIASLRIPDYRTAYQTSKKFSPNRILLCSYQVWVLAKIRQLYKQFGNRKQVLSVIKTDQYLFSLEQFNNEQINGQEQTCNGNGDGVRRPQLLIA